MEAMKISTYIVIVICLISECYAHERTYNDKEITELSAFIVDGVIEDKKLIYRQMNDKVQLEKYEYQFRVINIIRGAKYIDKDVITMAQEIASGAEIHADNSFEIGDELRYFGNRGKFKDGEFIPFSKFTDKRMRSFKHNFSISPHVARSELFNTPIGNEDKKITEILPDDNVIPKRPVIKPSTDVNVTEEKKVTLIWWIVFVVVILLIGLFMIARNKK